MVSRPRGTGSVGDSVGEGAHTLTHTNGPGEEATARAKSEASRASNARRDMGGVHKAAHLLVAPSTSAVVCALT